MALAIVRSGGPHVVVHLQEASAAATTVAPAATSATTEKPKDPSPLSIVPAELYWAGGCFVVLLVLMRLVLYPRVADGMAARAGHIRTDHAAAGADRDGALQESQQYEAQLALVRADAARVLDAARTQVEQERQQALAEATARVNAHRQAAAAEVETARAAAAGQLSDTTADVVTHAASIVLGRDPDPAVVRRAVAAAMNGGAR